MFRQMALSFAFVGLVSGGPSLASDVVARDMGQTPAPATPGATNGQHAQTPPRARPRVRRRTNFFGPLLGLGLLAGAAAGGAAAAGSSNSSPQ